MTDIIKIGRGYGMTCIVAEQIRAQVNRQVDAQTSETGEKVEGLAAELALFNRPIAFVLHDAHPCGAKTNVLCHRVVYGGRKGHSAMRRLREIVQTYETYKRRLQGVTYTVSLDSGARITWIDDKGREHAERLEADHG